MAPWRWILYDPKHVGVKWILCDFNVFLINMCISWLLLIMWFHIDSEQYDCQVIPTFECKWLHVHLLLSQFHQIERSNSCFITIQQANYVKRHELKRGEHRQSRVLLWESINYQAKDTRAVCHIRHTNGDSTNPDVVFNTLRAGDADLRFYITTVQDGWRKSVFLTRAYFPCTIHLIMQYREPVSEWSCWRMFIETWPHSELTFRHRASSV